MPLLVVLTGLTPRLDPEMTPLLALSLNNRSVSAFTGTLIAVMDQSMT